MEGNLMEKSIIQGIKRLRVLTPCDYDNMDKLALDLSNALEESSHRGLSVSKVKKNRPWKRRSKSTGSLAILGSSVPKSSAVSDDSESSLDFRVRHPMELSTNGSQPPSDSDDIKKSVRYKQELTSWRHCSINLGESDSVNENFHPSREQRRKRKFKRMTVDPQPIVEPELAKLSCGSLFSQKSKRVRCLKATKTKKLSKLCDTALENLCGGLVEKSTIYSGKRKRSVREKSLECSAYDDCHELISRKPICVNHLMELDSICEKWHEVSSSGLSSSESDCGILTNDESREADDEQSDFFHEPGPDCGIPGISAWWEEEQFLANNATLAEQKFDGELPEDFYSFPESAKHIYQVQVGRQIRSGRRRLINVQPTTDTTADKVSSDPSKTKEGNPYLSKCHETTVGKIFINDIKRRRRMPPFTGSIHGWETGVNFDQAGENLKSTLKGFAKVKMYGPECSKETDAVAHSRAQVPLPPPPPPPSPQLFNTANRDFSRGFDSLTSPSFGPCGDEILNSHRHVAM